MAKTITKEDGTEETVFEQADLDALAAQKEAEKEAALKEKDDHVKEKLDQFQNGKTAAQLKEEESNAKVAEAQKKADEALALAQTSEQRRVASIEQFAIDQIAGANEELQKQIRDAIPMVNMEAKDDKDIMKKIELAARMAGINVGAAMSPVYAPSGGYAPTPKSDAVSDGDHETFLKAVGLK